MDVYKEIGRLAEKYLASKIVLFGSRARGDNRLTSDIDIAVYGMPEKNRALFWSEIDDMDTLLGIDIVHVQESTDELLIRNIEREGRAIYEQV